MFPPDRDGHNGHELPSSKISVLIILSLGLVLRVLCAITPAISTNDEVYQYIEQSFRLIHGYGVVPWEYSVGLRNPIVPFFLLAPQFIAEAIGGMGAAPLGARLATGILSLTVVVSSLVIGMRFSRTHAVLAASVSSTWPILIYFSVHPTSETISLALFMPALAILTGRAPAPRSWLVSAGLLLALCCVTRLQLGAAALALILTYLWRNRSLEAITPVLAGGIAGVALSGVFDVAFGFPPLAWAYKNVVINIFQGVAATFGTSPPYFYVGYFIVEWGAAAIPVGLLALIGARRNPEIFVVLVVHLVAHSAIGHKEVRFVLLVETLAIMLAALGTAEVIVASAITAGRHRTASVLISLLVWLGFGTSAALAEVNRYRWTQGTNRSRLTSEAGALPQLCGLALYRTLGFYDFAGYSTLGRKVPVYLFTPGFGMAEADVDPNLSKSTPAFNVVMVPRGEASLLPPIFHEVSCSGTGFARPNFTGHRPLAREDEAICLYVRAGPCFPEMGAKFELVRLAPSIGPQSL